MNLGTLDVGATGLQTVTVTNTGKGTSGIPAVTATAGITATGCSSALAPNGTCTITIVAAPTAIGAFSGQVSIAATPGASTPLVVSVIATVTPIGLFTVSPGTIDLGNVAVGVPAPKQTITVTAAAVAINDLTVSSSGADVSIDKAATTCTTALPAKTSCTIAVNFVAASSGAKNDSVVISGGGASGKVVTVPISANAQAPAKLVINPSGAQSFAVAAGSTSSAITFGVANTGDVATGSLTVAVSGPNAASFTATNNCLILAPLAGCTVSVTYKPSTTATESATLTVTDSGPGASTVSVALTGTALPPSNLTITSTTTDLGSVLVGNQGAPVVFTVTNIGDTASGNVTVAVSSPEFVITNDTCSNTTLAAKTGACTVSIALKPTTLGAKSAQLTVNNAGGNPAVKMITGTGITLPKLTATPNSWDFATVRVNKIGTAQTFTVKNEGGSNTGALSFTRSGNFAVFPIASNGCSAGLAPGATCTFTVNFAPTDPKSETASYTVTDGATSATVSLSGTGLPASGISISPSPVGACAEPNLLPTRANQTTSQCFPTTVVGGTSSTIAFTIKADDPLPAGLADTGILTVALAGTNPTDFTIVTNGCPTAAGLLAGASCQVVVAFSPTATGQRQASLSATSANGGSDSATLQGTGLSVVEIRPLDTIDPETYKEITGLDFGQVTLLGDTSTNHTYMVIVRGPNSDASHISQVLTTLTDPSQPADFSYAPALTNRCNTATNEAVTLDFVKQTATGSSNWDYVAAAKTFVCTFSVRFYPQSSKGAKTATLAVTGTGPATDTKTLTGTATGALTFSPNDPSFGTTWQVGDSTNAQSASTVVSLSGEDVTVTLENHSSTTDFGPASLTLGGANADQFIIVRDFCTSITLAHGGGSCLVSLAFVPTSSGQKTGVLTANAGAETASVTITGGATDPFDITIAPDQWVPANDNVHDFGTVAQTSSSAWTAFTISNPAGSPRSAQVIYGLESSGAYNLADGNNHAFGTCGNSGTTTLAPGSSCTFWVQFMPRVSDTVGAKPIIGWIFATDVAKNKTVEVQASGKVSSIVSIAPATYTFPDTAEGSTSAATTLTVTNNGTTMITLGIPLNEAPPAGIAPFNIDQTTGCAGGARTLAAGATCPMVVNFVGQVGKLGTVKDTELVVTANASNATATTKLTGTTVKPAKLEAVGYNNNVGTGAGQAAPFYQTINLGGVRIGSQSGDVTLTFKNTGSVPTSSLSYQWEGVAAANTADAEFIIVNESTTGCVGKTSLAADATCTVTVHFTPSSTSAAGARGPKKFTLSATTGGVVQIFQFAAYALDPANSGWVGISGGVNGFYTFPGLTPSTGSTFPNQVFQVTNGTAGNVTLGLSLSDTANFTLNTQGADAGSAPCGTVLNASSSCTFGVRFHPTAWTETTVYRHAVVTAAGFTGTQLGVYGRVQSPAVLSLTPDPLAATNPFDFGQVVIGTTPSKAFTVTNTGESTSAALTISSTLPSQFAFSGACDAATLAPAASCVGAVTFTPGTLVQEFAGTFFATAPGVGESTETASVAADSVYNTTLAVNVSTMGFTAQPVGTPSAPKAVTLSNAANAMTSGLLTIALVDSTNFTIISTGDCPVASNTTFTEGLAGGDSCIVTVAFQPQTLGTGTFTTALTMTGSPGNTQTVNITGTAVSALNTMVPAVTSVVVAPSTHNTIATAFAVTVWLAADAPDTAYIKTSLTGGNYMIVQDECVATKLSGGDSCQILVVALGSTDTPLRSGTLTINGGTAGNSATLTLNSTTPAVQ